MRKIFFILPFLLIFLLGFLNLSFSDQSQRISGKVLLKGADGQELAASHVSVFVYEKRKLISSGKTDKNGLFMLFPERGLRLKPTGTYTVVVRADEREKNQPGRRIRSVKTKVKGDELNDVTIRSTTIKNRGGGKQKGQILLVSEEMSF